MLFDLRSGKRQVVVKVVYATLAILMGGSLVLFGIGSDAPGGILDALGLGGSNGGSDDPQYEQQIENAEKKLETDPENTQAMLDLVRYHYLEATVGIETNPNTGEVSISDGASDELDATVAAWQDYLKDDPKQPNAAAATSAAQAYQFLNDPSGAAEAQEIVAESQKTAAAYGLLAQYLYADFQFAAADAAAERAVALADSSQQKQIEKSLTAYGDAAREYEKDLEKQREKNEDKGGGSEDPFSAIGARSDALGTPAP